MPKLVILDANSLLYRGFFAMRYLSTSDRTPTNAVFAFVMMLLTILEREKPDAIFAAFDHPTPTFRHKELASYKAQRKPIPDDLKPQRQPARDAAVAFNVPVIEVEGVEADDAVGTLAEIAKNEGYEVLIVTGDGDALQLVDDDQGPVKVMMMVKGVTDTVIYDAKAVRDRYGLDPSQIPDLKGIKGDSSDNLPGVPGIGEKGASKLLGQYKTLEELIYHVDELPVKQRDALITHTDGALQCKRLATILRDVPLGDIDLNANYQENGPDFAAVRALFEKLEFHTLLRRLPGLEAAQRAKGGATPPAPVTTPITRSQIKHTVPTDTAAIDEALKRFTGASTPIGLQLYFTPAKATLMEANLKGVGLAIEGEGAYIDWAHASPTLKAYLEDANQPKTVHDLKFVTGLLGRNGVNVRGVTFDTHLAAYLLNAGRTGYPLRDLAADFAGTELLFDEDDPESSVADEAAAVAALREPLLTRLEADGLTQILFDIELPLADVLARIERTGVTVDGDILKDASKRLGELMAGLEAEIYAIAGEEFAIGSTKKLQEILFDKLKLPAGKKNKTGYSTGAEVLDDLAAKGHEIASKIIAWRELSKLKSTYADALPALINKETGKVHTSLNQTVTSTGRLSSSNPNLQNIPIRTEVGREIRKAFVASPGNVLVSADYSQIELRLFAHMTHDPGLVQAFAAHDDIHSRTARLIFKIPEGEPVTSDQRRQAKTINFAVIYGASAFRVSAELGVSQATSSELIKTYLASYPGVREYLEKILEDARTKGYVQTMLGRRRYVPEVNSTNYQFRQAAEREAANMPVQGTSADIIKLAMLKVDKALTDQKLMAKMVLQVHDELLFECPEDEVRALAALVKEGMETAFPLDVPLSVEVKSGRNWWEVTPLEDLDEAEGLAVD
jgi:DNA polymerase-1